MKKRIINSALIIIVACIAASSALLVSCSKPKDYRTDENKFATVTEGKTQLSGYLYLVDYNATLDICDADGNVLQSFALPNVGNEYYTSLDFSYAFEEAKFQDMNFDSFPDLYVPLSVTTTNLEGMAWLWDAEKSEFVLSDELSRLYELTVVAEEEMITSFDRTDLERIIQRDYKWEDGKLTQISEYTVTN